MMTKVKTRGICRQAAVRIQAMLPAPPVLGGQGSSHQGTSSGKPGLIERFVESTGIMDTLQQISPWLEQMELEYIIPQKPDHVSKQSQKTVYLSRYTFQVLIYRPTNAGCRI
ncbi:hypothetical protein [Paenibacillus thiaminolyticus]|uniref:hypothetical protein n=1 Tax=Paenibacillus thiaminolyticus TaxID=49283 RepID=UPI00254301DE|nr:hypothetical protein [Paenibacillus thiaminolyticus]WII36485.1 hypothetical protein O0V01_22910 [Paenibacillus thiaminolyticus]